MIARRFQLFYTPAAAAAANVQKMTNKRYATSIHGQNLSKTYKSVKINPGSTLFLASQDALEVMRVTESLSHLLSVLIDFTDVTLVSDDI